MPISTPLEIQKITWEMNRKFSIATISGDPNLDSGGKTMGYKPNFIDGHEVPLPTPSTRLITDAYADGEYIHHSKYSLLFNEKRGFAFCAAHNIDSKTMAKEQLSSRSFKADPKITPKSIQVLNEQGYKNNSWDRGHLARRKSMSWGTTDDEIKTAELESDFYSNIAPQHENLHDDAWGEIEDWMLDKVHLNAKRACVFTGPVMTPDDPTYQANGRDVIQIPMGFWKVVVIPDGPDIKSASFLVWQRDYDNDVPLVFSPILEQVRLTTIEVLTGLDFHGLSRKDALLFAALKENARYSAFKMKAEPADIKLSHLPKTDAPPSSMAIFSPDDIVI